MATRRKHGQYFTTRALAAEWPVPAAAEPLEPRRLLSAYVVTNLSDSGPGSLRDAIRQANGNPGSDIVAFATGLSGTIALTSILEISDDLTVDGPGSGVLTISGGGSTRVCIVDAVTATLQGLTITGGATVGYNPQPAGGAGITNFGRLTLLDSTVSGNFASWFSGGGAAAKLANGESAAAAGVSNFGSLNVANCAIYGNSASLRGDAAFPVGGGIGNSGTLDVINTLFFANSSTGGGLGGIGALVNTGGAARVSGCTFSGNFGAGIGNTGTLSVDRSVISGNDGISGGGIDNTGTLTVFGGTISGNRCANDGGGIFNFQGTLTLLGSSVWGNSNTGILSSATLAIVDSTVFQNSGGGINNLNGALTLTNSTVAANYGISGFGYGGGVFGAGTIVLNNSIVAGNSADGAPDDIDAASGATVDPQSSHNLIESPSAAGLVNGANGNIVGADPMLGLPGNYGGLTETLPLEPGSPAIDVGSNALAIGPEGKPLLTDQRGYARYFNGTVDIGAVEYGSSPLTPGDANGDGKVNFADLLALAQNYGKAGGFTWSDGDFDEDGKVDFADLLLLAQNYGRGQAGRARPAPIFAQ